MNGWPKHIVLIENENHPMYCLDQATSDLSWLYADSELKDSFGVYGRELKFEKILIGENDTAEDVAKRLPKTDESCLLYLDLEWKCGTNDFVQAQKLIECGHYGLNDQHLLVVASGHNPSRMNNYFVDLMDHSPYVCKRLASFLNIDQARSSINKGLHLWLTIYPIHLLDHFWQETSKWFSGDVGYPHGWHDIARYQSKDGAWPTTMEHQLRKYLGTLPQDWFTTPKGSVLHETLKTICGYNFENTDISPSPVSLTLVFMMGVWYGLGEEIKDLNHINLCNVLAGFQWQNTSEIYARYSESLPKSDDRRHIKDAIKSIFNLGTKLAFNDKSNEKIILVQTVPLFNSDGSAMIPLSMPKTLFGRLVKVIENNKHTADYSSIHTGSVFRYVKDKFVDSIDMSWNSSLDSLCLTLRPVNSTRKD